MICSDQQHKRGAHRNERLCEKRNSRHGQRLQAYRTTWKGWQHHQDAMRIVYRSVVHTGTSGKEQGLHRKNNITRFSVVGPMRRLFPGGINHSFIHSFHPTADPIPRHQVNSWLWILPSTSCLDLSRFIVSISDALSSQLEADYSNRYVLNMTNQDLSHCTTTFRVSRPHRITRNRPTVSCSTCRTRKLKCDRQQPCGACQKRGQEDSCRFESAPKQLGPSSISGNQNRIRIELRQMQHVLQGLLNQSGRAQPIQPGGQVVLPCGQLMESINRIQNVLEDDGGPRAVTTLDAQQPPDLVFASFSKATLRDIIAALPPRQVADRTISAYFNAKYVTVPFIHTHQFRRQYEAFWSNPAAANLLWVSIIFSVLATGAVVLGAKAASTSDPHYPSAYVTMSARCLVAGQYQKAAEFSVEALVMHAHSRSFQRGNKDVDMSQLQALAVRLAQQRCYHREVDKLLPTVTPFEAEMRRRVWYIIQYYDVLFSLEQGLPPLVHEDTFSTRHPTNVTDDDFDEDVDYLTPRPIEEAQPMLPCVYISHLLPILRHIIRHALGFKTCTYSDAMSLEAELETWYASIPACLRIRAIKDTSFTDPNHTVMQRIMLELIYTMGTVLLYRPFLDLMKLKNHECQVALNVCRRMAVRSVGVYVEVDHEMQKGGRLYEDQPIASSLSVNDFLITTIVAPLEFFDCPNLP